MSRRVACALQFGGWVRMVAQMLDERKSEFELLEHVIKGVHVEGHGPKNHRVVDRPLDQADDTSPRATPASRPKLTR